MHLIIPAAVRILANRFKNLCQGTVPGSYFVGLEMLFAYFLFEFDSVCDLLRQNAWTLSESQFLSMIEHFPANRFMTRMRSSILRKYKGRLNVNDFLFAIDDTDNPKYSKHLSNVSNWRSSKGTYKGQKIMLLALVNRRERFAIPLTYCFVMPKNHPDHIKGPDAAVRLVKDAVAFGFPKLPLVCDSWFDSVEMVKALQSFGVRYYWEMKSNRNAKNNPGPNVKWSKLHDIFRPLNRILVPKHHATHEARWVASTRIMISKLPRIIAAVGVYNRKNGRDAFAFYACSELSVSGAEIWQVSRARWAIECLFRDLKQNLSFGKFHCSNDNASHLAVVVPFIIVTVMRIEPEILGCQSNGKTIGTIAKELRGEEFQRNLDRLINNPRCTKLIALAQRRRAINSKPRVSSCGFDIAV